VLQVQPGDAVSKWLVAGVWLAAIACAAQRPDVAAPPPSNSLSPVAANSDPNPDNELHRQIHQLEQAIDAPRTQLGIAPPVDPMATLSAERNCTPGPSAACQDVCRLDESICDNAKKICLLADQLTDDAWAAQQCVNARATCDASHDKCCACKS
jgi:hypothetical protein